MPSSTPERPDVFLVSAEGPLLATAEDAVSLIGEALSAGASRVAIPGGRLEPAFLDLSSRLAGEFLQKFTNYRLRVAIVGDISVALAASKPLQAFVAESNRGESVWFLPSHEAMQARLSKAEP